MKKVGLMLAIAGLLGFSACSKCYKCETLVGTTTEYCAEDYNSVQLDALETTCKATGGKWTSK